MILNGRRGPRTPWRALDELRRLTRAQTPSSPPFESSTDVSVDQRRDRKKLRWWVFGKTRSPADDLLRLGERLEKRQDLRGAEDAYRRADAAGSAEGASNLGVLLFERGAVEEAHAALLRADERGSGMGAFRLGFLLEETGRIAEAESAYRRAVARGNRNAAGNLAGLHKRRGVVSGPSPVRRPASREPSIWALRWHCEVRTPKRDRGSNRW